jgi:hypothetical protein
VARPATDDEQYRTTKSGATIERIIAPLFSLRSTYTFATPPLPRNAEHM